MWDQICTFEFKILPFCSTSPEGVSDADLVLLVTTRPTTGNTLAWAVACERDQWGRAIAGILSHKHVGFSGFFVISHLECLRTESTSVPLQDMLMLRLAIWLLRQRLYFPLLLYMRFVVLSVCGCMRSFMCDIVHPLDSFFQVMHVLGFDPHAFAHFRDERKRRRNQV